MAVAVKSLGLPWIHTGVTCGNCHVTPITGYRYKCDSCVNHELCEKCFRLGHTQMGHNFLRIARDSNNFHPPFQVYYIVCDECGTAPIEGRRYHHRWRPNRNLCIDCFSKQPQAAREYEAIEEVKIPTICTTHSPVFHFHKRCGSCGVKPISGPRFDSIQYPDYSLCLVCFDTKFIKGTIKNEEFIRVERPETNKVCQIFVYSCMSCGEVPICGPAYVNQRVPEKVFCLLCYMNVPRQVQFEYSRVDPPTQLGDPPAPAISQQGALSHSGSVRSEDYSKLAREFELYRQEKEEKEEAAKVMAKKFMELNEKFVKQQTLGRSGDGELERLKREKAEAVLECAKLSDDIERLRKEKEDDAEYATRIYVSRIEALEKELAASQEEATKGVASLESLREEFEKLKIEKEDAAEFASVARELDTSDADTKKMHASLALEFEKLKEEHSELTIQFELLKEKSNEDSRLSAERFEKQLLEYSTLSVQAENEKEELLIIMNSLESQKSVLEDAARNSAEKQEQLVRDQLSLTEDYNTLMEAKEAVEKERDELALSNATLMEEVLKLKTEIAEAREQGEETHKAELLSLSGEMEKLKQMHFTLTTEYENLIKAKEDAAIVFAEKYDSLAKEHLTLNEEFDEWKEERAQVEREWEAKHGQLTKETMILKERGETESLFAEKYANLEATHLQYKEEREFEIRELAEKLKRLEEEYLRHKEETEETARVAAGSEADIVAENKKLKEEAAEWADLIEQFQRLVKDTEAKSLEAEQLLKNKEAELLELAQLLKEKEAEAAKSSSDYSALYEDYEGLDKENQELIEKYEMLKKDLEFEKAQKEGHVKSLKEYIATLEEKVKDGESSLAQELDSLKEELARAEETTKLSRAEFLELSEDYESLQEDVAGKEKTYKNLKQEYEMLKNEKEEEIADLIDSIQNLEKRLKEKEAAPKMENPSALMKQVESLKEELRAMEEDKHMAENNAAGLIHELQKQVEKLENALKDKEAVVVSSAVSSGKKMEGQGVSREQYDKLLAENETLREEIESVQEDFDEIYPKFQKLFQSKVTKDEFDRLKAEYDRLKANVPAGILSVNTPGVGKCALLAICCYGVINERKKESLEEGYEKSRRNCKDQDLLRQSVEFMNEAVKELDKQFDNYMEEALTISDKEAEEFFLTLQPMFDTGKKPTPLSKTLSTKVVKGGGQGGSRK